MNFSADRTGPGTTTDRVFNRLHEDILSLKLPPGTRISEAEVAGRMGVSRQPVRDAFNRLGNLGLLRIRPQRATEVRGFSMDEISNARFLRLAIELEVVEAACAVWNDACTVALEENLAQQRAAAGQVEEFHSLDHAFHRLICRLSGHPLAFDTIEQHKRAVDRLCVLRLGDDQEIAGILQDHEGIARALSARSVAEARAATRRHLGRLDDTIATIRKAHAGYFD